MTPRDGLERKRAPLLVPALDGLRGILTIVVLLHHVFTSVFFILPGAPTAHLMRFAAPIAGSEITLPIYFVISGFVIFLPAARGDGTLGNLAWYAVRRVARILPAYYVSLAVLLLAWPFLFAGLPSPLVSQRGIQILFGHLGFLQKMLFDESDIGFGMNGSVWTLTLEECFYGAIPVVSLVLFRKPWRVLAGAFALTMTWRVVCLHLPELCAALGLEAPDELLPSHLFHQFPGYAFQFACGSVAALVYVRRYGDFDGPRAQRGLRLVHFACLAVLLVEVELAGLFRTMKHGIVRDLQRDVTPALVFAVMIVAVALGPRSAERVYTSRVSRFLGDVSYGVYLWHMILIQVVYRAFALGAGTAEHAIVVLLATVLPGSLLLGWLSFRYLERPVSLYARELWKEREANRATASVSASG